MESEGLYRLMIRMANDIEVIKKQLNPIVKINKELRADIKKVLSHCKKPRKQPDGSAWKKNKVSGFERDDVA